MIQNTGPAEAHHMGPIMPLNIIQTGAHPKFEKKEGEEPKKEEPKKEEPKKEEAKK